MYKNGKNISFTDRSNSCVNMYLRDIGTSKPLTTEEEYELWHLMRRGSYHARSKLINSNLRYVVTIAKKYLVSGAAFEDLLMAGSLGITKAADLFDASMGYRFISYATWFIESEIRKTAYDHITFKRTNVSLDQPTDSDEDDSNTMIDSLCSSSEVSPDWHLCYDDTLNALKKRLDNHYWQGAGEMLDDYLSMLKAGYSISDFARKHNLSDQQMRNFLHMVHAMSDRVLNAA